MAEKKNNNLRNLMPIVILAGVGVGGYFIWKKYFKKEKEPVIEKEDFIISKLEYPAEALANSEINVTVFGKNLKEEGDCYCRIVNNKTSQIVFDEHLIVGSGQLHPFVYTTIMPADNLDLRIETGKWIDTIRERHSYQDILIKVTFEAFEVSVSIDDLY